MGLSSASQRLQTRLGQRARGGKMRLAGRGELPEVAEYLRAAGPDGVLVGARVTEKMEARNMAGEVLIVRENGRLRGACWWGGTMMPVGFPAFDVPALADWASKRGSGCTSIVGQARIVVPLWRELAPTWPRARDVRPDQPLLQIVSQPLVDPDPAVRRARDSEVEAILPASIAMFVEELGFPPPGTRAAYRSRVADLIRRGRTYVRMGPTPDGPDEVQFKADIGATIGSHAQIHGVWTHPALRGRGLATRGMATVVADALARGFTSVSLYVNAHNTPALSAYDAVGFERVGTWATILF